MEKHEKLYKIIKKKADATPYKDKTNKTRSGMTRFQEYLRKNGIKEHRDDEPYDQKKYLATDHPAAWACDFYYECPASLLVPKELAIKILTLGTMP
jgi:hypothetical protein